MEKTTDPQLDSRAARMLAIFAERRFQGRRSNDQLRIKMLLWSIRTKILRGLTRAVELVVASLALLLTSPLLLLTALMVRLESPGPALVRQMRVGKGGEHFACLTFRTTRAGDEGHGGPQGDTRVGRAIRGLGIDDLPQLFNVLKGELSFFGPRRALQSEVASYTIEQIGRLNAIPGMGELPQSPDPSRPVFKRWVELDLKYISEQSVWKDIVNLLRALAAASLTKGSS